MILYSRLVGEWVPMCVMGWGGVGEGVPEESRRDREGRVGSMGARLEQAQRTPRAEALGKFWAYLGLDEDST